MKLRIFILFLFLPLLRAQASVIDSLMTHPRDSIGLTSDSLVLHFLEESGIPISDNNKVKLLKSGREKFIDLFEAIRQAKHHVHLEYFNFRNDSIANALFALLAEKVKEGVEVRAMFDAFGNWSNNQPLKKRHLKKIREQGIEIVKFDPFTFPYINHAAHRDHRKIVVIDGNVAYTGGVNLADEYINAEQRFGYWKDAAIRLEGAAVWNFTVIFLNCWNAFRPQETDYAPFAPTHLPESSDGVVQPYTDSPLDEEPLAETVYLNILAQAQRYVYIYTPYLAVGEEMLDALKTAAKRGVDVRLVLPGIPDKKLVFRLSRSYYVPLLRAGVRIYEYTPGFLHAKCYVSDDHLAVVGSINMDYRSLFLHFECGALLYSNSQVIALREDVLATLPQCREVQLSDCRTSLPGTLLDSVLRLLSPLL